MSTTRTATGTDPDLLYTDVEDALRSSLRDLLASRCRPEAVTATYDGDRSVVAPLWQAVAVDLGLAGLLVPESLGGAGASAREAAVVLEELSRFVAPVPFLTSSVLATLVLVRAADRAAGRTGTGTGTADRGIDRGIDLLGGLAAGRRTAALAVPWPTGPAWFEATVRADADGSLTGRVATVAGALEADALLVPVAASGPAGGVEVWAVDTEAPGVAVTPVSSLDMSRQLADLSFDAVGAGASDGVACVVPAADGRAAVLHAVRRGAGLLASEQVGIAQWCLDATVGYLQERRQFGRVVGGFQAVKHRLADLYVLVEQARAAARYAAATIADDDPDAEVAASVAQAYCADAAVQVAEDCVQLHGGLGMTWEHPAHLYLKRAKTDQIALGTAADHRSRLAELVDLPMERSVAP